MEAPAISLDELHGRTLHAFDYVHHSLLSLFFDFDPDAFNQSGRRLYIDCAWRFVREDAIVVGSANDASAIVSALESMVGEDVASTRVNRFNGDIVVEFTGGARIETFNYARRFCQWEFQRFDGLRIGFGEGAVPYFRMETPDS